MNPLARILVEVGPLATFFLLNARGDDLIASLEGTSPGAMLAENGIDQPIFLATAGFMAATLVSLVISYGVERRLPIMPMVSGIFVLGFGTLTLVLQDEEFIKLKPTITNSLFAIILFGGLAFGRPLLRPLFGTVLELSHRGWRILTIRWACFFVVLAVLNEVVWRNFSTDVWVDFKVFGIMPLTLVFAMAQLPLLKRESTAAVVAETDRPPAQ